ncbi:MAG: protein-disulfide reductase DsbD domain-containing protein [Flavobacteriaceae bacterium]
MEALHRVSLVLLTCLAVLLAARPAAAADASPWAEGLSDRSRLVAGSSEGGSWLAGVEIVLDEGWKTYWRNPGDSGIPPRFDFSGSTNLERAEVLYPAPHRFADGGGTSIGYKGRVLFPVRVVPRDPARPVELHLVADYGVCEKLCVPAHAEHALALAPGRPDLLGSVPAALATVPGPDERGSLSVRLDAGKPPVAVFAYAAPEGARDVDLFVEPPKGWYLAAAEPAGRDAAGARLFRLVLDGLPDGVRPQGAKIAVTAVHDGGGVTSVLRLD